MSPVKTRATHSAKPRSATRKVTSATTIRRRSELFCRQHGPLVSRRGGCSSAGTSSMLCRMALLRQTVEARLSSFQERFEQEAVPQLRVRWSTAGQVWSGRPQVSDTRLLEFALVRRLLLSRWPWPSRPSPPEWPWWEVRTFPPAVTSSAGCRVRGLRGVPDRQPPHARRQGMACARGKRHASRRQHDPASDRVR